MESPPVWMDGACGLSDTRGTTGILGDGGFGERLVMGLLQRKDMYKPPTFLEPFFLFLREDAFLYSPRRLPDNIPSVQSPCANL